MIRQKVSQKTIDDCTDCMNCKDYDCCTSPQKTLTEFEKACHMGKIITDE